MQIGLIEKVITIELVDAGEEAPNRGLEEPEDHEQALEQAGTR